MAAQAYTQDSDRDAVDNAIYDARWQLVLGTLGADEAPFGQGSLPRFRASPHDLDRRLVHRTVELARETGLFGDRNLRGVLDSSPLRGAAHAKHVWSTNMLERLNEELKRRTHIVRVFPDESSCLRLVRALAVEQHEEWEEGSVYLNMQSFHDERRKRLLDEVA